MPDPNDSEDRTDDRCRSHNDWDVCYSHSGLEEAHSFLRSYLVCYHHYDLHSSFHCLLATSAEIGDLRFDMS